MRQDVAGGLQQKPNGTAQTPNAALTPSAAMLPGALSSAGEARRLSSTPPDPAAAGAALHLVMPWFFPLATLVAWLGVRTVRNHRSEGRTARTTARWLLVLMSLPLVFWFIAQFTTTSGAFE